jgi:prepilin-type N-terminal cleavage/methylation domain-containing protein
MYNKNHGFTLIELIVVLGIISMITAIGASYLGSDRFKLKKDAMILYNNFEKAKRLAITNRTTQSITFNTGANSYTLNLTINNSSQTVTVHLSPVVEFGDGGHGTTAYHTAKFGNGLTASFYPNGSCSPSGGVYLKLKNSNDDVYNIKINISGNIQLYKWNGASWEK